jgi:hypothetical protein
MNDEDWAKLNKNLAALTRDPGCAKLAAQAKQFEEMGKLFGPRPTAVPADLIPGHPQYSAKAAAVFDARRAVRPDNLGNLTEKQALTKWLTAHAGDYKPKLSKAAIKECAAVANWGVKGGARKTPGTPPSRTGKPRG